MQENFTHVKDEIMSLILEVRYTDLEEEKRLSGELLAWAQKEKDSYGEAFGYTYLGDYYIAQNDMKEAGVHLKNAEKLIQEEAGWDPLIQRIYSLLGIYYEVIADEQTSIQYYLDAITVAKRLEDVLAECMILNNLAYAFQRNHKYDEAMKYYEAAYDKLKDKSDFSVKPMIVSNLADLSVMMGRMEDAKKYILECEQLGEDLQDGKFFCVRNWCVYYAAQNDTEKALEYADTILREVDTDEGTRLSAFENFKELCQAMLVIGNQERAYRFLRLMEQTVGAEGIEQMQALEEKRINYSLLFEDEERHKESYRNFYIKDQEFKQRINRTITNAMKAKIDLDNLLQQKQSFQSEQKELELEANLDEMTKIYNRRYLDNLMSQRANGIVGKSLGYIMLDVDYFKEYNDNYGHVEGDNVLKVVASCLKTHAIDGMFVCRYGGDEFACLCDGLTNREVEQYVKKVRDDLHNRNIPHKKSFCSDRVTLSVGYAVEREKAGLEVYLLFQVADQALYESKRSGRNTYTRKRVETI